MKLVIISHTAHYRRGDVIVGWEPTVREIDRLAALFKKVIHIAPVYSGEPSQSFQPYQSERVSVETLKPSGGPHAWHKLSYLWHIPGYCVTILKELRDADAVHVRFPCGIALIAMCLLSILRSPTKKWFKYAGDWNPSVQDSWTFRFQRFWLRQKWHRGWVTVNGQWPNQPPWVVSFFNPCMDEKELKEAYERSNGKKLRTPLWLLFVGNLEETKGILTALDILVGVLRGGTEATLDIIGEGRLKSRAEALSESLGICDKVNFRGALSRSALNEFYARAHMILLPSHSEGWPKVLSEAMAHGTVPLAGAVGAIPQYLSRFSGGRAIPPDDVERFVKEVRDYAAHPSLWEQHSTCVRQHAVCFTYEGYLQVVSKLFESVAA